MGDITKLPKWAQEHIKTVTREREEAIRTLNKYCDEQTPSAMYVDEMICTGEEQGPTFKKKYFQGHRIEIKHAEVHLSILLRDDRIDMGWVGTSHSNEVAFIPKSYMQADLVSRDNMRYYKRHND